MSFHRARRNFVQSLAGYSIISYLLQLKDRHNGNILLHANGSIIHIDFGFLLSNSPGKVRVHARDGTPPCTRASLVEPITTLAAQRTIAAQHSARIRTPTDHPSRPPTPLPPLARLVAQNMGFEAAPFKLTGEWVELMGGIGSPWFRYYRTLVVRGFQEARRHRDKLLLIAQATYKGVGGSFPCFRAGEHTLEALRQRFQPDMTPQQYARFASNLIDNSLDNWRTGAYDCVSDHSLSPSFPLASDFIIVWCFGADQC